MNRLYALLILAALAVPAFAQSKDTKRMITVTYDKFKDRTYVETDMWPLRTDGPALTLYVGATHSGEKPQGGPFIGLHFSVTSINLWWFDGIETSLILLIDGKRLYFDHVPIEAVKAAPYVQSASAGLGAKDLERIATAKTVEGQLGAVEFTLRPEQQKAMVALLDYLSGHPK